jgi:uncharacterized membrane protein
MRAIGIREIASGVGVLSGSGQFWMKTRLGGDAMDLALMSRVMRSPGANRNRAIAATVAVAGIAALDALSTRRLGNESNAWGDDGSVDVFRSITINRSPEEVYRFWHDFGNLPRFMHHLEAVQVTGTLTSHWVAKAPFGREVEWDAEIVEDRPGELIAWRSIEGSEIPNSGSVRFSPAPNGRGTEVSVTIQYEPPAGKAGALLARMLGEEPHVQLRDDLRRLKQVLETGDVVVSEGSPKGTGVPLRKQRAAQPLSANAELQTQP